MLHADPATESSLLPHEFLKVSHKSTQPRSLNLVLLQILLPQWTASEIVI